MSSQSAILNSIASTRRQMSEDDAPLAAKFPYRATVHQELSFAADCRRVGNASLARRAIARAHYNLHLAIYWQPVP